MTMTVTNGMGIRGSTIPILGSGGGGGGGGTPPILQPSGFPLPTLDLPNFDLAWIDDFNRPVGEDTLTTNGVASAFDKLYGIEFHNDLAGGTPIEIRTYPSTFLDTSDRGRYGGSIASVAAGSSILNARIRYEAGWPRVFAWIPRLGRLIPGVPWGVNDVYGGAFELVWKVDVIPTYKFVPLWWPLSNHRVTANGVDANGELDFPEFNLWANAVIQAFIHWQGDVSTDTKTEQTSYASSKVGAGTGWHKTRLEWIPGILSTTNPTRSIGGSVRLILDDLLVKTILGSVDGVTGPFIPAKPMHMVVQQECHLGAAAIDQSATGNLQVDYAAFWRYTGPVPAGI